MPDDANVPSFVDQLTSFLNRHSQENESNTPDFILAKYLKDCLFAYNRAVVSRANWYGRMDSPGEGSIPFAIKPPQYRCPQCGSNDPAVIIASVMEQHCENDWHGR